MCSSTKAAIIARGQAHAEPASPRKPAAARALVERARRRCRADASPADASSMPAIRRLPKQPMPKRVGSSARENQQLDGAARAKAGALQRADGFQSAQHADRAVVSGRRCGMASMCEPVPTAASAGSAPGQRAKVLPTASSRSVEPGLRAQTLHVGARAPVRFGEDHARHRGRGRVGKRRPASPVRSASRCRSRLSSFMAVPVFVDQVFRGRLPSAPNHCGQ